MRIKTSNDTIIHVNKSQRSITVEGVEFGSDCRALTSKRKDMLKHVFSVVKIHDNSTIIHFRFYKFFGAYEERKAKINLSYEETLKILNSY